jgi:hypothetical protein
MVCCNIPEDLNFINTAGNTSNLATGNSRNELVEFKPL